MTYYLFDDVNQLEERDVSGALQARYTHGFSKRGGIGTVVEIERHAGGATYYQYGLGGLKKAERLLREMHRAMVPEWNRRVKQALSPPPAPPRPKNSR